MGEIWLTTEVRLLTSCTSVMWMMCLLLLTYIVLVYNECLQFPANILGLISCIVISELLYIIIS